MSGFVVRRDGRGLLARVWVSLLVVVGLSATIAVVGLQVVDARGPAYPGPQTTADSPAYFGPAPNPLPYCDSPTYFDPWAENVVPTGRLDVGDSASVTTDGMTMTVEIVEEGDPGGQYPGFFPFGGEGAPNDRAKGFELASGDSAVLTLSQPLFYAQFIFTDVDQPGEGFEVIPDWAVEGEVIAYGGDDQFTFDGTTPNLIVLDDLDGTGHSSELVEGRAQIDMLGAVNGISLRRPPTRIDPDTGQEVATQGQSGLSVAGGCEASGAAKVLTSGPTWNGTSFEVTYELRLRNNMPTEQTILDVVQAAQANAQSTFATADPTSIDLEELRLQDQLSDPAFSTITVTSLTADTNDLLLNNSYDGLADDELLLDGSSLSAETDALITLSVEYTPDPGVTAWVDCVDGYDYLNQSAVSATVAGVAVSDLSDDGINPAPSSRNGAGGVDDPTPVLFPCLPAELDIVKTVVPGPAGQCPSFDNGVPGDGAPLQVLVDDTVTYCISVTNNDPGVATNVVVTDPQAPADFDIGTLAGDEEITVSYDLQVDLNTPILNTATVNGQGANGDLGPVSDTAVIAINEHDPVLEIVKTVIEGPAGQCPVFADGVPGDGDALPVTDGDTVTYCISIQNTGVGDATNVIISDVQAPADFDIGDLASGAEHTVFYDLEVSLTTPEVNTATATGEGPYGPVPEVSDTAVIDPTPLPDPVLEIVKTVIEGPAGQCPVFADGVPGDGDALPVTDGDTVTYCISIQNTGVGDATNVIISDVQAPADFDIGDLASGAEHTVFYDLEVSLTTPEVNTATATGEGPYGPVPEVSDTAVIDPTPLPDPVLEIVKTVIEGPAGQCPVFADGVPGDGDALPVTDGDTVTYCISIQNTGVGDATNVIISDVQAPADFDIGDLASGAEHTVFYDLEVSLTTPEVNTATATGEGPYGPVPEVSDTAVIDPTPLPDPVLEIVKTVIEGPDGACPVHDDGVRGIGDPLIVNVGDTVTYCISIQNTGVGDATNVTITDPQAPETFDIGELASSAEQTVAYDLEISGDTGLINVATVTGEGPNGEVPDDTDDAQIAPAEADMAITKTVSDRGPVDPGTTLTYTLVVTNNGPDRAAGVSVTDQLPAGLTYLSLPPTNGWACALHATGQAFTCLRAAQMEPGESDTLTYTVTVTSNTAPATVYNNTASVTSTTPDTDPTNNTDTALTRTRVPPTLPPPPRPPDYPGPFTPPPPLDPPDEVLGLAITGSSTQQLGLLAAAMMATGATLTVASRRTRHKRPN